MSEEKDVPFIFLGVANQISREQGSLPFPFNPIDIFQLSQFKRHLIYPAHVKGTWGIFLVNQRLIEILQQQDPEIIFRSDNGKEIWNVKISAVPQTASPSLPSKSSSPDPTPITPSAPKPVVASIATSGQAQTSSNTTELPSETFIHRIGGWGLVALPLPSNVMVPEPSKYTIEGHWEGRKAVLGEIHYLYQATPPFTPEEINAIKANPNAATSLRVVIGCQKCPAKIRAYAGLERDPMMERDGFTWHTELGDTFKCECGTTVLPLKYMKESLHALLGRDAKLYAGPLNLDYVGLHAHAGIMKIIQEFNRLLDKHKDEATFQQFIQDHHLMLARFSPIRLAHKLDIIGKYQTDFAILDASRTLIFIELERPGLRLFQKNGHPRADLTHAYEQVRDWMQEYNKYPDAILERLKLDATQIMAVKGVVIAGRSKGEDKRHMQRHLSNPIYPNIELLTYDDLSASLHQISLHLA